MQNETLEFCGKLLARLTGKQVILNDRVTKRRVTLTLEAGRRSEAVPLFQQALAKQGILLAAAGADGLVLTELPNAPK